MAVAFIGLVAVLPVAGSWTAGIPWTGVIPTMTAEGALLAGQIEEGSTAALLGIQPGDRVIAVGDVRPPPADSPAPADLFLRAVANRYRAGDTARWIVERDGERAPLAGPFQRLPRALLVSHYLTYLPFLAIAFFLAWLRRSDAQVRLLVFTILAMVAGNYLRPITEMSLDTPLGIALQEACALGRFLGPALLVHWATTFPKPTLSPRAQRRVLSLGYGLPFVLFLAEQGFLLRGIFDGDAPYLLYTGPIARLGYFQLRFWVFIGSFVATGALLIHAYRRIDGQARKKVKWVVWSVCVVAALDAALVATAFYFQGGYQDVVLGPYRNVLYSLTAIGLGIAVLREDLFDIDWMIRRSTVYFLSAGAAFVLFSLLEEVVTNVLSQLAPGGSNFVATVVAGTVAAAVFVPLRRRLDRALGQLGAPGDEAGPARSAPGSSSA